MGRFTPTWAPFFIPRILLGLDRAGYTRRHEYTVTWSLVRLNDDCILLRKCPNRYPKPRPESLNPLT